MSFYLIPRVRVNYGFRDLIKALFVSERRDDARCECEKILSDYFDKEYVCLVTSGRDAIYELLIRLPQKKVLVPAYTCMAVIEAVKLANKDIVYCATDSSTYNASYLDYITPNCIVLATHQYGLPCNIEEIVQKCEETRAVLIEDCAASIGSTVNGKKVGTFGEYAIVSFNASKLINVPPVGGVLVSKNQEMVNRINNEAEWKRSNFSFKCKAIVKGFAYAMTKNACVYKLFHYIMIDSKGKLQNTEHDKPSIEKTDLYCYRFAEWQATILLRQLKRLQDLFARRKQLFTFYEKAIINPIVKKPVFDENAVYSRYAFQVEKRNDFYKQCVKQGVDMDLSHCFIGCPQTFEEEHVIAKKILNLPFYFNISRKELKKVADVVNSIK